MVRADVAGDVRRHEDVRAGRKVEPGVAGGQIERVGREGAVGRGAERAHGKAGEQVMHHGVPDRDDVKDPVSGSADLLAHPLDQAVEPVHELLPQYPPPAGLRSV